MQRQFRSEKRNSSGVGRLGKSQAACFQKIVLCFFLLSFFSCTTTNLKNQDLGIKSIETAVKSVCLAGSGRGQIRFLTGEYSFDFETLLEKESELWALGVILPFYGEEVMRINYKNAYAGKYELTGSFSKRLFRDTKKTGRAYLDLLRKFIYNYALFLKFYTNIEKRTHSCQEEGNKGYCKLLSGNVFNYEYKPKRLDVIFKDKDNFSFHLIFSHGDKGKFRRIRGYLENHREAGMKRKPIMLDLILSNCL